MARDALGKLREADELNKTATKIRKKDPASAAELDVLARGKRKSAIKQLRTKPRGRKSTGLKVN